MIYSVIMSHVLSKKLVTVMFIVFKSMFTLQVLQYYLYSLFFMKYDFLFFSLHGRSDCYLNAATIKLQFELFTQSDQHAQKDSVDDAHQPTVPGSNSSHSLDDNVNVG